MELDNGGNLKFEYGKPDDLWYLKILLFHEESFLAFLFSYFKGSNRAMISFYRDFARLTMYIN
jgi:hypothetical protein